jgi:hypothetical protein
MGLFSKKTATATAGDGGSASPTGGNISGGGMMASMLRQMIDSGQITGPQSTSATDMNLNLIDDRFEGKSMKKGGSVKKYAKGGTVKSSSASKRADGCAIRGKTRA